MGKCFVVIPFDGKEGMFTNRYEGTYSKAITQAGFEPYRVDEDPAVEGILEDIIKEITGAEVVFADISLDNPNVWFEVGYALALDKPLLMVSDKKLRPGEYPFDVRHRRVVEFKPDSKRDFDTLESEIAKRIKAIFEKRQNLSAVKNLTIDTKGLSQMEIAVLISVMQNQEGTSSDVTFNNINDDMYTAGYNRLALNLALPSLEKKGYLLSHYVDNEWGGKYAIYTVTDAGYDWLNGNMHLLNLTVEKETPTDNLDFSGNNVNDDVPF